MASSSCTGWHARSYISGWNAWYTDFNNAASDGYCYTSKKSSYAYCFYFKTPSVAMFYQSTSLNITIPIIRLGKDYWTYGTLYFKLLTSDPTGGSIGSDLTPSSSSYDASCTWSSNDQQVHTVSFTINSTSLKPDTGYYITVGGDHFVGIGYLGYTPADGYWSATFNYSTYENGTAPNIAFSDQGNNKCIISGTLGKTGDNNGYKSATLYYTTNGREPNSSYDWTTPVSLTATSGGAYSKSIDIPAGCNKVWAVTYCVFQYNTTSTGHQSASVKYYVEPGAPGKPALTAASFKNNRLTIKQNWTYSWTAASAGNSNSPIKGYRLRLYKNNVNIPIKLADGTQISTPNGGGDYVYDTWNTNTSITIDPVVHGFKPGDTVKLGIYSFTLNGKNAILWNGGGDGEDQVNSDTSTVQNAGVVNVKVGGTWKEGQVWIKSNGSWHEAETVNAKVSSSWVESQ